ncbi:enoyl-CoA hydratase/isomerase family protein [Amycolatopsis palatopharyngis]|uniref:enoyl-CoA hydratase/isomerase family protein n=1 Tax=Amycolatopsis palatopharyngis TaxID=187982 RepID=UPI000E23196F|nr:enoyl-CoA hydratase-related protein [Amycolatopsis palatopharyngis]
MPSVRDVDQIRWVTFSRPEKLNALTREDITVAREAVADTPEGVRAVVFAGAGRRAFSAGVHVQVFHGLSARDARSFISELGDLLSAARRAPVPTLCAINGYCLGAGMELALACDLRVATTDAVFGMPEIKVGIPSVLDAALLQQHLGLGKAKELLLTGGLYGVAELDAHGFLNKIVPPDELEKVTIDLARAVAGHSPVAMAAQKRLFETWQNVGLQAAIDASVGEFAEVFADPDARERINSYRPDDS